MLGQTALPTETAISCLGSQDCDALHADGPPRCWTIRALAGEHHRQRLLEHVWRGFFFWRCCCYCCCGDVASLLPLLHRSCCCKLLHAAAVNDQHSLPLLWWLALALHVVALQAQRCVLVAAVGRDAAGAAERLCTCVAPLELGRQHRIPACGGTSKGLGSDSDLSERDGLADSCAGYRFCGKPVSAEARQTASCDALDFVGCVSCVWGLPCTLLCSPYRSCPRVGTDHFHIPATALAQINTCLLEVSLSHMLLHLRLCPKFALRA